MKIGFFAPDQTPVSTLACQFAGIKKILFLGDCFVIMYYLLSKKEDSLTKDKSKKTLLHMSFGKWFLNNPIFFSFKTNICRQKCLILILKIQDCVKCSENEFISIDFLVFKMWGVCCLYYDVIKCCYGLSNLMAHQRIPKYNMHLIQG